MLTLLLALTTLLALDAAALRRGVDSRALDPRTHTRSLP